MLHGGGEAVQINTCFKQNKPLVLGYLAVAAVEIASPFNLKDADAAKLSVVGMDLLNFACSRKKPTLLPLPDPVLHFLELPRYD